jgi:hypothetical protein
MLTFLLGWLRVNGFLLLIFLFSMGIFLREEIWLKKRVEKEKEGERCGYLS